MKYAADYPVTFKYGATGKPYSRTNPHRGEDRYMPENTIIKVNGLAIGLSGKTGRVTGPHIHVQKVAKGFIVNPAGDGFKLPAPVTVTETGYDGALGYYVRLRDAKKVEWSYFHLSKILVERGILQDMYKGKNAQAWYKEAHDWHTKAEMYKSTSATWQRRAENRASVIKQHEEKIGQLSAELNAERNKPTMVIQPTESTTTTFTFEPEPIADEAPKKSFWDALRDLFKKKQ